MHPVNHSDTAIWIVIFVFLTFLVGSFIFVQYEIMQLRTAISSLPSSRPQTTTVTQTITQIVTPIPTATVFPTSLPTGSGIAQVMTTPKPQTRITYLPLIGGSTQNTDWVSVAGSAFLLNIGDYGGQSYATWDANLRVDNANGTTYARLFDTTHGIVVNGSEISIDNTSTSTDVVSGQLSFWQGNNSYVVQVKSLNSSTAFMDSGRIKIVY